MKKATLFVVTAGVLGLGACSREDVSAIATSAGTSYNASYKDNVVKNWQSNVAGAPRCQEFKIRFKSAGDRHSNAANGAFAMDMMKIWEEAKSAQCGSAV